MNDRAEALTDPRQGPGRGSGRPGASGRVLPWLLVSLVLAGTLGLWWWKSRAAPTGAADGAAAQAIIASGGQGGGAAGRRFGGSGAPQPVSVEAVRRQDIHLEVDAIGSVAAANTAVVRAQVTGVLQSLNFKEGQQVQAGQLLAQIDPRAFQTTLSQAEGALARDQAQLDGARTDFERYRGLLAKDAIPQQQFSTQQALVHQLEGTVAADQGAVASARLQLSYTRVVAPIAGRVGLRQADLGNTVQPSDAAGIVSIAQTRPVALVFSVPAANVPTIVAQLHANRVLPVQAFDRSGKAPLAVGRVATIDNAIDPGTDTIKVKAWFANADDALFPNQAVSVRLQVGMLNDALAVPQAAVLRGAQGFYVYVVGGDGTVGARVVKPGPVDGGWMAVEGPLQAGDRVVIDGVDRLREGARVEVIASDPSQRAGATAPPGAGRRGQRGDAAHRAASAPAAAAHTAASAPAAAAHPAASAPAAATGERPAWMDRLPPELADKLMKMSPDERQEWIRQRREERARQGAAGG